MRELIQQFIDAVAWAPPQFGVSVIGAIVSAFVVWVWLNITDQARLRKHRNQVWAALLELRVYSDEPRSTGRAVRALFAANYGYLTAAIPAALLTLTPVALLLVQLNAFYGYAPLPVGQDAVVTMRMGGTWDGKSVPGILPPPQIAITSPAVRSLDTREISWRIRPLTALSGHLEWVVSGYSVGLRFEAGGKWRPVPAAFRSRTREVLGAAIRYPEARANWMLWFWGASLAVALLLRNRLGGMI